MFRADHAAPERPVDWLNIDEVVNRILFWAHSRGGRRLLVALGVIAVSLVIVVPLYMRSAAAARPQTIVEEPTPTLPTTHSSAASAVFSPVVLPNINSSGVGRFGLPLQSTPVTTTAAAPTTAATNLRPRSQTQSAPTAPPATTPPATAAPVPATTPATIPLPADTGVAVPYNP